MGFSMDGSEWSAARGARCESAPIARYRHPIDRSWHLWGHMKRAKGATVKVLFVGPDAPSSGYKCIVEVVEKEEGYAVCGIFPNRNSVSQAHCRSLLRAARVSQLFQQHPSDTPYLPEIKRVSSGVSLAGWWGLKFLRTCISG